MIVVRCGRMGSNYSEKRRGVSRNFRGGGGVLPLICFSDGVQTQNALCLPFFKLNFLTKRGGGGFSDLYGSATRT